MSRKPHHYPLLAVVIILGLMFWQMSSAKVLAEDLNDQLSPVVYKVKSGDTLSHIAKRFGTSVQEIMRINNLSSFMIFVGQTVSIPKENTRDVYEVKPGDNLSRIAKRYSVTVKQLKAANGLSSSLIRPKQRLVIPSRNHSVESVYASANTPDRISLSTEDLHLLAKMIHAESRGEPLKGQIAVGAVILNRVKSDQFPDTVEGVIFQRTKSGGYQFSPVQDGSINLEPDERAYEAAQAALDGEDPTNGALFFYNPDIATDKWIRTLPVSYSIGNHVFAR